MKTTEIIRILRKCGVCGLTDCTECPEYTEPEEEGYGFMWSCGGVLLEAADRLEKLSQNMSGDLISRSALLEEYEWLKSQVNPCSVAEVEEHMERIRNAPAVEAEPVVHAHWVGTQYDGYADGCPVYDLWECSECREEYESEGDPPPYDRCPHCGAYMDEEVADES